MRLRLLLVLAAVAAVLALVMGAVPAAATEIGSSDNPVARVVLKAPVHA